MLRLPSLQQIAIMLPALIFAFTIHEISHGLMAYLLGDATAKRDGRLSLNPIRHIDPLGLIFILFAGFGWAKPVMVNPNNLKNPKVDMALISIAGPISNFIMAFLAVMLMYPFLVLNLPMYVIQVLSAFITLNIVLGVFNLLPVPPLDGSKVVAGLLPDALYERLPQFSRYGMVILLLLMVTGVLADVIGPITGAIRDMLFDVTQFIYGFIL